MQSTTTDRSDNVLSTLKFLQNTKVCNLFKAPPSPSDPSVPRVSIHDLRDMLVSGKPRTHAHVLTLNARKFSYANLETVRRVTKSLGFLIMFYRN